jgi:uncharacterized protein YdiU (UPF0061 family)
LRTATPPPSGLLRGGGSDTAAGPYLVAFNPDAAALLDLDPRKRQAELIGYLSGNRRLPGAEPIAQAYAGHQFGVWVPQLGDGSLPG